MIIGIAIENWKYPIFERRLKERGYTIKDLTAMNEETVLVRVEAPNYEEVLDISVVANNEARNANNPAR